MKETVWQTALRDRSYWNRVSHDLMFLNLHQEWMNSFRRWCLLDVLLAQRQICSTKMKMFITPPNLHQTHSDTSWLCVGMPETIRCYSNWLWHVSAASHLQLAYNLLTIDFKDTDLSLCTYNILVFYVTVFVFKGLWRRRRNSTVFLLWIHTIQETDAKYR